MCGIFGARSMTKRPIRVMILVDKFDYHGSSINGPSRYFSWILPRIDRGRFQPFLCSLRSAWKSDLLFRQEGIDVEYFGLSKYDPRTLRRVVHFIRHHQIDVLHLSGYGSTTFGRMAARLCRKPAIVQEHWVDPGIGWSQRIVERVLSPWTTWAIAISEGAKQFLVEKKHVRADRVEIIPNGIPLDRFTNLPDEAGWKKREELGIPRESPVIGIVGMFHEIKGHRYFLEAAASVTRSFPDAVFLIVGDGEIRADLEHRLGKSRLLKNVRLLGQREDIPELLQAMDVYVCASISETFPLTVLEAMASGRAIVTTDCGGPSEMIRDGWSGFVVPIRNSGALAEKIALVLGDASRRTSFGHNAAMQAKAYDIRVTVAELERLYANACSDMRPLPRGTGSGDKL
jgi:glycosyltransferase involved in cell wall biosynthesis